MKIINPTVLTTAMVDASSLDEDDFPEWVSGTTYAEGDKVILAATHRIYESVTGGNIGNDPAASGAHWLDIGPTNRWAMFDQVVGTSSVGTGSIDVSLSPGSVGALAVLDTDAEVVRVTVVVDSTTIYDVTKSTNAGGGMIVDWYEYFTADVGKVDTLVFADLPKYSNSVVTCELTGVDPGGPVSVGTLLVGTVIDLGMTGAGVTVGISDFSRKEVDDFGSTMIVERAWAKRMTVRSMVMTAQVDSIQRRLAGVRAKPALYLGEEGFDSLAIYGFYKDFSIDLALANISYCSLTIEGLI